METRYPVLPAGTHSAYVKLARRESDFPICSAAAVVAVDSKNICQKIAVALGAVGPTPIRALAVEESLIGKKLEAAAIDRASAYAEQGTNPTSDMHGSGEYRKAMARIMTKKAIMTALGRK
jgi:carbon-monoxide dehydrogenase medium subunit